MSRWKIRCPFGHTQLYHRRGGFACKEPTAEWYCESCRLSPSRDNYHYDDNEIERSEPTGKNVDRGYVWSPSHDEVDA